MYETILREMNAQMITRYGAVIGSQDEYERYLEESQHFVAGYTLNNEQINFSLLSDGDLASLDPAQREYAEQAKESPFHEIMVIFYEEEDEICCKYIGGMASNLRFTTAAMIERLRLARM